MKQSVPFLNLQGITQRHQTEISEAVQQVISSGWYLNGESLARFEAKFARYCGVQWCVGVSNGLDALTLVLTALKQLKGWSDDAEVILPAHTFIATALAVTRAGLRPVFCDVSEQNYLMQASTVASCITSKTRALLPVHLYGQMCNMSEIMNLADEYGLEVVEDAAQAHGAKFQEQKAGTWGTAAAYSFYPGKNLGALGDAGAVVTRDAALAERVRVLANYGATQKYHHEFSGCNSRMDEIQAAILSVKLDFLDADNEHRRELASLYGRHIHHPEVVLPYSRKTEASVFHIYPIFCESREALQKHLEQCGVSTLVHYPIPVHRQTAYKHLPTSNCPVSERLADTELSLPISPVLTKEQALYVCDAVNSFRGWKNTLL